MLDWAADEGWNPGLHDAVAFHAADPEGFLLGSIDGEAVAAISLVRYDASFAFLGLYLVRPAHRGRGYGMAMWLAAMERAGERTVGLDGVVERQGDYARSGFVLVRRNVRYGGIGGGPAPGGLTPLATVDPERLAAFDREIFPAPRAPFLAAWTRSPGAHGVAALNSDGAVAGYGVARPCRTGLKIGPLFADDPMTAERLYGGLSAWAGEVPIFLDVPEPNEGARRIMMAHVLAPVFETARMYAGTAPREPVDRIFGVTTFELG
jgi:hypothetical protein